jgi:hypothetical protein
MVQSDTPHSAVLLWTRDRPVAETSTWQHATFTRDTNIHAHRGIRTRNPSKRSTANSRLKPLDHWNQRSGRSAPLIPNLGCRRRWKFSVTPRSFHPRERTPGRLGNSRTIWTFWTKDTFLVQPVIRTSDSPSRPRKTTESQSWESVSQQRYETVPFKHNYYFNLLSLVYILSKYTTDNLDFLSHKTKQVLGRLLARFIHEITQLSEKLRQRLLH